MPMPMPMPMPMSIPMSTPKSTPMPMSMSTSKSTPMSFHEIQPNVRYINLLQCEPSFSEGPRRIYDHQFVYVHKGKGMMQIGDVLYTTLPGDLFFYGPSIRHAFYADNADPYLLTGIHFDFTQHNKQMLLPIGPIVSGNNTEEQAIKSVSFSDFIGFPPHINLAGNNKIRELIFELLHEFQGGRLFSTNYVNGLFSSFLTIVARQISVSEQGLDFDDDRISLVISFIQDHFNQNLTNEGIAKRFHFHPNYLNQLVKAHTGIPLRQYIIDIRIRKALDMLLHTDNTIVEISKAVGYEDIHYFSRIFKKKTGCSPMQMKQGIHETCNGQL